ncbi:hypothetical protein IT087_00490, partial [Candidatus Uhrbacteria bacterium]|nr:hypothetical protein [Candidatus Uhrbacteria bacterium]
MFRQKNRPHQAAAGGSDPLELGGSDGTGGGGGRLEGLGIRRISSHRGGYWRMATIIMPTFRATNAKTHKPTNNSSMLTSHAHRIIFEEDDQALDVRSGKGNVVERGEKTPKEVPMRKLYLVFAFVVAWPLPGCVAGEGDLRDPEMMAPEPVGEFHLPRIEAEAFDIPRVRETLDPVWQPSWHPQGTLLVDAAGDLWMVGEHETRLPVSGDDTLGYVSLDEHDAIPMSPDEERCLVPDESRYWGPGNYAWWPVYGLYEEDRGPFILDGERFVRRPVSHEVLESWGYYWRWMDYFDGGEDEWLSYTFEDDPVPFRDGSLARTELGTYYLLHGRAYLFRPAELALEAGYREEDMQMMNETRLRELAIVTTSFTRETFETCPL